MTQIISFILSFISVFGLYSQTFMVVNIDYQNDVVEMVDGNGNIWAFNGTDDWREEDYVSCIMYKNGTDEIYDDVILMTRYSGDAKLFQEYK